MWAKNQFCVKVLNVLFHLTSLNMQILCFRLSFCFVILRETVNQFLKLKPLNQNPLKVLITTEKTNFSNEKLKPLHN